MSAATRDRILSLDVMRGLAVLGILAVNAPFFAHAFHAIATPSAWPFAPTMTSQAIIWLVRTFFEVKFITMFSMLFGASIYLVGGERRDAERSPVLHRRLGWLILFGLLHGILIWYGDVLTAYALAGFLVMLVRSLSPRRLIMLGAILYGVLALFALAGFVIAVLDPSFNAPMQAAAHRLGYTRGFVDSLRANATDWAFIGAPMVLGHMIIAGPLMLIGMGLFKAGVLGGAASTRLYRRLVAVGALALIVIGTLNALQMRYGSSSVVGALADALLTPAAPLITLGYVSLIVLVLRRFGESAFIARVLAPVGRMAFTNYIMQSVVMTAIFYGGRGLGLYGQLDRPAIYAIVAGVWIAQILISRWWLSRFAMGPLEWGWRRLSYGRTPRMRTVTAA